MWSTAAAGLDGTNANSTCHTWVKFLNQSKRIIFPTRTQRLELPLSSITFAAFRKKITKSFMAFTFDRGWLAVAN